MADEDRKQIGLTDHGRAAVSRLTEQLGWFDEAQDAGRFALAYAIKAKIESSETIAPVETRWSPDLFDPTGELRLILRATYPNTTMPIRLMEHLIDEGFRLIQARIDDGELSPTSLLS